MTDKTVRIGSASGFWGDTASAAPALVKGGDIGYLVFDYLAEVTMSILAAQKAKDASAGYATDFVHITMKALLPELKAKGIKVVANAGGVNSAGLPRCAGPGGGRAGRDAEDRRGAGRRPERARRRVPRAGRDRDVQRRALPAAHAPASTPTWARCPSRRRWAKAATWSSPAAASTRR